MAEIVGVRFKEVGKIYYFDPCGKVYDLGSQVIVRRPGGWNAAPSPSPTGRWRTRAL